MTVTPMTVDFKKVPDHRQHPSGVTRDKVDKPRTADGKVLTPKQIRSRARRKMKRYNRMSDEEFHFLYKPVEEWDLEELARGRPRNQRGTFQGPTPTWISREVHERSMELFKSAIKTEMNSATPSAMNAILHMLQNEDIDDKGKPVVPPSTKLDAAKFLLEHVVGKPTQRVENDVSVRLQAILGVVMANPAEALMPGSQGGEGYSVGHLPGVTMPMAMQDGTIAGEVIDDDDDLNEDSDG